MNTALADAAAERVDELLPLQHQLGDLLGLPEDRPALQQLRRRREDEARKGGRPAGARNRRLADLAQLLRAHFGDVLLQQVAVATMPLADLMALGLKAEAALAEKRLSAATVLPYIEQKQPIRVDMTGKPPVYLTVELGSQPIGNASQSGAAILHFDGAIFDGAANPLIPLGNPAGGQLIVDQASGDDGLAPSRGQPEAAAVSAESPAAVSADAAPATPARPPGGAVSGPPRLPRAPAGVVPPRSRILPRTENQTSAAPGAGGVAP